ncbi:MAG: hypothetical protein IOD12_00295, partial [Silvanigrellales bacterium]|nr:hypothetical protein [Silvanigrellales bacterium]
MDTKNTPPKEPAWQAEVRAHFESQKVGIHQASSLEALLLFSPVAQSVPQTLAHSVRVGASSVLTASVPPLGEEPLNPPLPPVAAGLLSRTVRRAHASGVGYVVAALAAASATFLVQQERGFGGFDDDAFDPIADLASQPGPRAYPADFDLEGDPAGFREVVQEVFPQQDVFSADLGKQLAGGGYTPS